MSRFNSKTNKKSNKLYEQLVRFCFTSYERTDLPEIDIPFESITYIVFQKEVTKTNLVHWQGYCHMKKKTTLGSIKKQFKMNTMHIEKAFGTIEKNRAYCTKIDTRIGDVFEWGDPFHNTNENVIDNRTKRTVDKRKDDDLHDRMTSDVQFGMGYDDFVNKYYNEKPKWFNNVNTKDVFSARDSEGHRFWKPVVFYFYGDKGTGKSHLSNVLCSNSFQNIKGIYEKDDFMWWEDYNGQDVIVIDDFYGGNVTWTQLLRLLDRKHCRVEKKGSKANILAKYIFITANGPYDNLYLKLRESHPNIDIGALERRLEYIVKFEGNLNSGVRRTFEKGDKNLFNERKFVVEFNEGSKHDDIMKVIGDKGGNINVNVRGLYEWVQLFDNDIYSNFVREDIDNNVDFVRYKNDNDRLDELRNEVELSRKEKGKRRIDSPDEYSGISDNDSVYTRNRKRRRFDNENDENVDQDELWGENEVWEEETVSSLNIELGESSNRNVDDDYENI